MDTTEPVLGLDRKIPFREKLFFPAIDGFYVLFNSLIQFYLNFIYGTKQQLISPYISTMLLVVPLIAAALIPAFGVFIDRRVRRRGKYKPWIFMTLLGTGIGAFLVFIPVNFGPAGTALYATVTDSLFCLFLAAFQAALIGAVTVITKNYDDRITIAAGSAVWSAVGSVVFSYTAQPVARLFGGPFNQGYGFQYYALICLIVGAVLTFLILKGTKERFVISPAPQADIGFGQTVKAFFKNKYALIAFFCTLLLPLQAIRMSFHIYYCLYVFGDTSMMGTLVLLSSAPAMLGMLISPFVLRKLDLKNTLLTAAAVNIVTSAAVFFLPGVPSGVIAFYVLTGLGSLLVGIAQPALSVMIPFAADYGEWKYHVSCGGFLGAVNGFSRAAASILISGGILGGLIMPLLGDTPQAAPSAVALVGTKCAVSFLPAVIFVLVLLLVLRWDLTREKHGEIVREVYARSRS